MTPAAADLLLARIAEAGLPISHRDRPTGNVTARGRAALACVHVRNVQETQTVVQLASAARVPLYPFSSGLNWGYGSRSAVIDGCVLVDLSAMRRIRNAADIGADNPVAVIEPGVTQGDLADFLAEHAPSLYFNVTGSARETSVLGASLDRGVGYFGPRRDDVFGLEVITGRGELLYTGMRRLGDDSSIAHSHPYGLGPQLDGLFFQGNFGIVTSACLRLRPRQPRHVALSIGIAQARDLPRVIDTLGHLKRSGALHTVTHIGNRARTHSTLLENIVRFLIDECHVKADTARVEAEHVLNRVAPYPWTGLAGVCGTPAQVRTAVRIVRAALRGQAKVRIVSARLLDLAIGLPGPLRRLPPLRAFVAAAAVTRPLQGLVAGEPTSAPVRDLMLRFGCSSNDPVGMLDESRCGLIYICPVLPLRGEGSVAALSRLEALAAKFGHTAYITLNIETDLAQVAVINLLFDRMDPLQTARAHTCADALLADIDAQGLSVYRARADMMGHITTDTRGHSTAFWDHVAALKRVFDPFDIIAPGRYNRVMIMGEDAS